MVTRLPDPRVEVIEGRRTLVVERRPPLPTTVGQLIAEMTIVERTPVKITGWRGECEGQDHRLVRVLRDHFGTDRQMRSLEELHQCRDCEAICIRDVTIDTLPGLAPGRLAPRRRNHVLAWYSGARRNQRTYKRDPSMGVTADTPTNLVVGAGNVLSDHANIGSSTDSNVFAIDREIFTPDLNGVKGALKGTDYITSSTGRLETTIPEVSGTIIVRGLPGFATTGAGAMEVINEDDTRRIPLTAYHDWEIQVPRLGGGAFQFEVDDAIQTGGLEFEAQDDGLIAPRFSLQSRWDPAALTASPHRIRILAVAS